LELKLERYADALNHFTTAVDIFTYVEGELSQYVVVCHENMADLYDRMNNTSKCE
jgi:hypothetical protein